MTCFQPADILLPQGIAWEDWAVIACDQFTSEPEYWRRVRERVGESPSALQLVFPEAELEHEPSERIRAINETMRRYERSGLFRTLEDSFVYTERTLSDGSCRRGLLGKIDLERYDYRPRSSAAIRATERTVVERIPPRVKIREGASLELPHVLLLCDDEQDAILAPLAAGGLGETLYDFELMEGGGHIRGLRVSGAAATAVCERIAAYETGVSARYADLSDTPMLYAVGDGNHSLASAKACFEALKQRLGPETAARHPARYALVELGNLHDDSLRFEPIHRLVTQTDVPALLEAARREIGAPEGPEIPWLSGGESGTLRLNAKLGLLPVGVLQEFLDRWLQKHPGKLDYIHGEDSLRSLAGAENSIGFFLPAIEKSAFFRGVMADGVLPRKTFSMGQARDKRYYLEARRIQTPG